MPALDTNTIYPQHTAFPQSQIALLNEFMSTIDTSASDEETAAVFRSTFSTDAVWTTQSARFQGIEEIVNSNYGRADTHPVRYLDRKVERVYINDAAGYDAMMCGWVKVELKEDKKEMIADFALRMEFVEEDGSVKLKYFQGWFRR